MTALIGCSEAASIPVPVNTDVRNVLSISNWSTMSVSLTPARRETTTAVPGTLMSVCLSDPETSSVKRAATAT